MTIPHVDKIGPGTWARIAGLRPGEDVVLEFVPKGKADPTEHKLSPDSLLGQTLMNATVGEKVPVHAVDGQIVLEVLDIDLIHNQNTFDSRRMKMARPTSATAPL
jgi:transcription elongation GreA/GreB family factor